MQPTVGASLEICTNRGRTRIRGVDRAYIKPHRGEEVRTQFRAGFGTELGFFAKFAVEAPENVTVPWRSSAV